jgi:hypothetical protein
MDNKKAKTISEFTIDELNQKLLQIRKRLKTTDSPKNQDDLRKLAVLVFEENEVLEELNKRGIINPLESKSGEL